jgi:uncharacterized protein (DUF2236 family)
LTTRRGRRSSVHCIRCDAIDIRLLGPRLVAASVPVQSPSTLVLVPTDQLTPIEGIRRELRRTVRSYITGQREVGGGAGVTEDSWFGPDSVTWLVHSDWSTIIGGVESLLVQTLHPPTMSGVADHSSYKDDPFGRLHRTANFIGTTTFGSSSDADSMVSRIRKIHDRVTGTTPSGEHYTANDPRNLGWVHATEVDGFLRGYRRYGAAKISDSEADQYVTEMARVGEALGVENAPRSVSELDTTLDSYRPELQFDAQARRAVRWLYLPPNKPIAQAPYLVILSAAINLLPSWARRKLWLPPTIPHVSDALVAPAAKTLIRGLDWIMQPTREISELRDSRNA